MKKVIIGVALLIPLIILFYTDSTTFALVRGLRQKPLVSYVKIIDGFGDGGLLLIFSLVIYALGHALSWDFQGRKEALKEVVRAPLNKKGKTWKALTKEVLGKLYLFLQSPLERAGFQGALALMMSGTITRLVKFLVGRPRPSKAAAGIVHWGPSLTQFHDSFPSGHATSAFAFATAIALSYPVLIPPLFIMAVLVCLARVYLGHHYFSDVYAGALVGLLSGFLARRVLKAMEASGGEETAAANPELPADSPGAFLDKEG